MSIFKNPQTQDTLEPFNLRGRRCSIRTWDTCTYTSILIVHTHVISLVYSFSCCTLIVSANYICKPVATTHPWICPCQGGHNLTVKEINYNLVTRWSKLFEVKIEYYNEYWYLLQGYEHSLVCHDQDSQ